MRKSIVLMAAFVVAAFAVGYLAGSANGVVRGFAANQPQISSTATPTTKCDGTRSSPPHFGGRMAGPHAVGTVSAVRGNTITLTPISRFGVQLSTATTIITNSSTTFFAGRGSAATISSVQPGDIVVASGTLSSDGKTLTATRLFVATPGSFQGHFRHGWGRMMPGQRDEMNGSLSTTL